MDVDKTTIVDVDDPNLLLFWFDPALVGLLLLFMYGGNGKAGEGVGTSCCCCC